eukprot:TRINITY_DN6028_c0_g2_i1.p1 TRINITY_DN6028_c0_g2~~TRINITY_DN6028_c0_g2_i1.p1  ORF type:complete len:376 (-),score=58.93 TRINITY_DN6028_c0_g2_i1:173-1300(-)
MNCINRSFLTTCVLFALCVSTCLGHFRPIPMKINTNEKQKSFYYQASNETHLQNIQAITSSGVNAEAYFSFDGKRLSFQAIRSPLGDTHPCDQIYTMNIDGSNIQLVSTGNGRDTCSYFTPDGNNVIYSSTQGGVNGEIGGPCPPIPDMNSGYLWPVYKSMNVYSVNLQTKQVTRLTNTDGYDAETTLSPNGKHVVFTSDRDGDLELYLADLNFTNIRRMTYSPGYDGGAFFSFDSNKLVWRANRPLGDDLTDYLNLLSLGLVAPVDMQIYVMLDINNPYSVVQLTNNNGVNFAPFFLPGDTGVIFSSNMHDPTGGDFQLYTVDLNGNNLQRITYDGSFNYFPMFSPNGQTLVWASNRNTQNPQDMNIMTATWVS